MSRPKIDQMKVTGNLVEDPARVSTGTGQNLVVMKLAENNRVFDREANGWVDGDPTYYQVAIDADSKRLGNLAENVAGSLHKGDRVSVEGAYSATPYQAKDGSLGVNHRVWAEEVAPSLKFATVQIERNPSSQATAQTQMSQGWDTVAPGAGVAPQTPPPATSAQEGAGTH